MKNSYVVTIHHTFFSTETLLFHINWYKLNAIQCLHDLFGVKKAGTINALDSLVRYHLSSSPPIS